MQTSAMIQALIKKKQQFFGVLTPLEFQNVLAQMQKPGDFFIFKENKDSDFLMLCYYKDMIPHKIYNQAANKNLNVFAPNTKFNFLKISIDEFDAEMGSDEEQLLEYIKRGLKKIVGWDFDQTLTYYPTWNTVEPIPVSLGLNRNSPDDTDKIMQALQQRDEFIQIIISNNHQDKIEEHTKAWFGDDGFIQTIWERNDFHSSGGDKEICFRKEYDSILENRTVNDEHFIRLNSHISIIDVVACYLIDDREEACQRMAWFAIRSVLAYLDNNSHLCFMDGEFNLQTGIVPKMGLQPPKPKQNSKQEEKTASSYGSSESEDEEKSEHNEKSSSEDDDESSSENTKILLDSIFYKSPGNN